MSRKAAITLNFETIASIIAMIVGVCALYVTWDQGQVMRKQQHAAVWPLVRSEFNFDSTSDLLEVSLVLENHGVGPALIEYSAMRLEGAKVQDWNQLLDYLPAPLQDNINANLGSTNGVLGAGESETVFRLRWLRTEETVSGMEQFAQKIVSMDAQSTIFDICYCSVFERCWRLEDTTAVRPASVNACPASGEDFTARLMETLDSQTLIENEEVEQ